MGNLFDQTSYPQSEPEILVAGDRWAWKRTDLGADYPPASYALTYSARLESTGTEIEITASESGQDYIVEVASATTAGYTVGIYSWQAYITRTADSERVTVGSGTFEIVANRDAASTDPRSHAKKVLDAIEAILEDRATKDQQAYTIRGRSLSRTPIPDLLELRKVYKAEVAREKQAEDIAAGRGHSGKIKVRL